MAIQILAQIPETKILLFSGQAANNAGFAVSHRLYDDCWMILLFDKDRTLHLFSKRDVFTCDRHGRVGGRTGPAITMEARF